MRYILDLFLPQYAGMRSWMSSPFTNSDKSVLFATDGPAMICINNIKNENNFENNEDKIKNIYPPSSNCHISFSFEKLNSALKSIKLINKKKCDECDGDGEVEWEYKSFTDIFECPACNGIGEIINSDDIYFNDKSGVKINDTIFYSGELKRLLHVMTLIRSKECIIISEKDKMTIFKLSDDIIIYQMGTLLTEYEIEIQN
jgi:DnaJ-class molecular chaperone